MKAIKSATASVKETVQNVKAKEEERGELSKAVAQAKAERKAAENKAGKHDAIANYHARQAEIIREYEQKKAQNKSVKEQTKAALHQKKVDKHADKTGAVSGDEEQATANPGPASDNQTSANPTEEKLEDRSPSTPASSDLPKPASEERQSSTRASSDLSETASEEREETTDTNGTINAEADSPPVHHSQVPMHGSGVPTHSEVHSDGNNTHDIHTTQTMGGSPNTGSYM